jgi:hypothetical protein
MANRHANDPLLTSGYCCAIRRGAKKESARVQLSLVFDILQPEAVPVVALI